MTIEEQKQAEVAKRRELALEYLDLKPHHFKGSVQEAREISLGLDKLGKLLEAINLLNQLG